MDQRTAHHGPGRPRDPRLDIAITEAAIAEIGEHGWQFSMDEVARRAHVGKATLYRRFPSKIALAIAAWQGDRDISFPTTDTGSIWGDLTAYVLGTIRMAEGRAWGRVVAALLQEATHDASVAATLDQVWAWRLAQVTAIVERARDRREVSGAASAEQVRDLIDGAIVLRLLVTRQPLDLAFADRLVDDVTATIGAR